MQAKENPNLILTTTTTTATNNILPVPDVPITVALHVHRIPPLPSWTAPTDALAIPLPLR
jgi:hypothetical protein